MASVPQLNLTVSDSSLSDPVAIVYAVIGYALLFVGAIALAFAIYGGVLFMTSGGDAEKTTKARNTLLYSVIGVIVVVLAYAILMWAQSFALKAV